MITYKGVDAAEGRSEEHIYTYIRRRMQDSSFAATAADDVQEHEVDEDVIITTIDADELINPLQGPVETVRQYVRDLNSAYAKKSEEVENVRADLADSVAMIKKREGQVITARHKVLAADQVIEGLRVELAEHISRTDQYETDKIRLEEDITRLTTENREFKKVSRVVALENENTRLVQENARLHDMLTKSKSAAAVSARHVTSKEK